MLKRPSQPDNDVLDCFEASQLLKLSEKTVRKLAANGDIPGVLLGRQWRFSRELLLQYVRERSASNASTLAGHAIPREKSPQPVEVGRGPIVLDDANQSQ